MDYLLATMLAVTGLAVLFWNKSLSENLGAFYSQRFSATFGTFARALGWDNPNKPFNKFLYRGFVITAGIIFLIFAFAVFFGPIYIGSAINGVN